jgi:HEAT repeat protein
MIKNIKKLIQKLGDKDPSVRRGAAEDLSEGDERAIYPLIKALSDENAGVQDAAMRSLISIGQGNEYFGEVAGYMILPLLREDSYLRNTALIILTSLNGVIVPLLYPLLKDKDDDIRKFAIDLMGDIKKGVKPSMIMPLLNDHNANVRAAAAKNLGLLGYRDSIPELIKALKDEEWVCFSALDALGELKAVEAVKDIGSLLGSSSEAVCFAAIETLGKIGSEKAVDVLIEYLPKASVDERSAVIKSLIQIGITPEMADLSGHLIKMLKDGDWEEKEIALKGIVSLNCREAVPVMVDIAGSLDPSMPESEERIGWLRDAIGSMDSEDELLNLLDSPDIKYRGKSFAIEVLGNARSKKAVSKLIDYLNDMRRDLRRASVEALGEIGESQSTDYLLEVSLKDVDAHVRRSAIEALGNIRARDAFKALMDLLEVEKYYDVIEKIVEALIKIDADVFLSEISRYRDNVREIIAKTVSDVDILLNLADDQNKKVKMAAIYGLGRIGTDKAVSRLIWFLGDSDPDVRKAAVVGLGEARYCSVELFNALQDNDPWVRFYTIKAIVFSCDKEKAVGMIGTMLHDEFIPVVMSAIDAIREIGGREAYDALAQHKEHPNPDVREKIKEALSLL